MKFRFCGDQDCPDWFLTQIATLSRLSSVKAKLLSQHVARRLMGQDLDMGKINSLLADSKLSPSEVQCLLSALEFVLSSASRFVTGEDHLRAELQQVGLPKETAAAVAKVHLESTSAIRDKLVDSSLRPKCGQFMGKTWKMWFGKMEKNRENPSPITIIVILDSQVFDLLTETPRFSTTAGTLSRYL
nr:EOG090X0HLW [Sida crystallina]